MSHPFIDVIAFHRKFGHPSPTDTEDRPSPELLDFRRHRIKEETEELCHELALASVELNRDGKVSRRRLGRIARECVDLVYVTVGTCVALGLNFLAAWAEVQRANMAKTPNPDGPLSKPLKGDGWRAPDCERAVNLNGSRKRGNE